MVRAMRMVCAMRVPPSGWRFGMRRRIPQPHPSGGTPFRIVMAVPLPSACRLRADASGSWRMRIRAGPAEADTTGSGGSEWTLGNSSGAAVTFATDGFTAGRRGRAERGQPELHTIKTVDIVVIIFARYTVATRRFDGPAGLFRRGRAEGRHHCRARGTRPASVAVHVAGQGTQVLPHRRPAAQPGRPRGRAHVP